MISILLPIFNRAHTLRRCVESALAQTERDWELLAVDDGSTDDSVAVVESYGDARIRVLRHAENQGASAARNTALAAAQGEWVACLDSDDEWLPTKLERQLAHLRATGDDGCGCEYFLVPEGGGAETHVRLPEPPEGWRKYLHTRCELGNGTTFLARRAALEACGPLDTGLRLYEDWDWLLRFTQEHRYSVVTEPLARVHASGPRNARLFAQSAERFLALHAAEFAREGAAYARAMRRLHLRYAAGNALRQGEWGLGARCAWKALRA